MKQIPGYSDYACDEQGNVYSLKYGKIRKLKPSDNGGGYQQVVLCVDGVTMTHKVHRLMAKTFLKDYAEDLQVDHIDRCRTNNHVSNLRIVTNKENDQNRNAKGYTYDKARNKYDTRIMVDGVRKCIGHFDTEEEARAAYIVEKLKLHPYYTDLDAV